jgi:hypothetical protein
VYGLDQPHDFLLDKFFILDGKTNKKPNHILSLLLGLGPLNNDFGLYGRGSRETSPFNMTKWRFQGLFIASAVRL